jgi:DNA-directed RNA polymerase specialized sigma24 family protein
VTPAADVRPAGLEESPAADMQVLGQVELAAVWQAFRRLPVKCRVLLRVLLSDPPPSYAEVSEALDIPIGSIGPSRSRCLERLRVASELVGLEA